MIGAVRWVATLAWVLAGLHAVQSAAHAQMQSKTTPTALSKRLPLIDTDTLLYVENKGLDRIFVTITGSRFRLVSDPTEVDRAANAFPIPRTGEITIHVGAFIEPGRGNYVEFASQGPPDAVADVVLAPVFVNGQTEVAYTIERLVPLPVGLNLRSYPNPFVDETTFQYEIPGIRLNSVDVQIAIYDVLGRRLAVLDEGPRFPGTFERIWEAPSSFASGVYFARILANGVPQATISLIHLR